MTPQDEHPPIAAYVDPTKMGLQHMTHRTTTVEIVVDVINENDEPPKFTRLVYTTYIEPPGTEVTYMLCNVRLN